MLGTKVLIVETIRAPGDKEANHNEAIEACVGRELSRGLHIASSATSAALMSPTGPNILRITTIVFAPTGK